jgi:hypothetical protein
MIKGLFRLELPNPDGLPPCAWMGKPLCLTQAGSSKDLDLSKGMGESTSARKSQNIRRGAEWVAADPRGVINSEWPLPFPCDGILPWV